MNILLIGLGSIGKKHIQALKDLEVEADIFALRSGHSLESVDGVVDISSVAEAPKCDFAMVCNPTNMHLQTIMELLPLEIPIFIEKPVVRHLSEIEPLQNINVPTYVACHLRHHPCLQYVQQSLGGKAVQDVRAYCGSYMPDWVPGRDWSKSFRANTEQSGGVHLELIHEMDYCYWLFGIPEAVQSELKKSGELGIDIIDNAHYRLTYPDFFAGIDVNYIDKKPRRSLDIVFNDGRWHIDILNFRIEKDGEEIFSSNMTIRDVYASQMRYFLDCINMGKPPMNSVQEAAKVLTLALS